MQLFHKINFNRILIKHEASRALCSIVYLEKCNKTREHSDRVVVYFKDIWVQVSEHSERQKGRVQNLNE